MKLTFLLGLLLRRDHVLEDSFKQLKQIDFTKVVHVGPIEFTDDIQAGTFIT